MAIAVPANLRAGEPEGGQLAAQPEWGPVVVTYGGTKEIPPDWVAAHRSDVRVLDVRTAAELDGELGRLGDSLHIPLDELRARSAEVPSDKPVVVVCQTGKRSAMGAAILEKAGFAKVANIAGGMVAWRSLGLPG
ncbi:MAG: rhodanese-like domain-containing protein [Myxococcaceae bacterium]